ncbi:MAG: hypothetical protein AB7V16_08730 [Vulcanibacillus sp.]
MVLKHKSELPKELGESEARLERVVVLAKSKERIELLENKLNYCEQAEIEELIYELKAEQTRFKRLKCELIKLY